MIALSRVWKLYFVYTIVLVVGVALAGFVLQAQVKKSLVEHLEEDALTLAKVMAQSLPATEDASDLDRFCDTFGRVAGARITLMDKEGKVVGESDAGAAQVGLKLDRPEVQEALAKGSGSGIRFSKSLRIDMLYMAFFSREKGKIIRLAVPMTKVRVFLNEVMIPFSLALFLVPFFAIFITFLFTKYEFHQGTQKPSKRFQYAGDPSRSESHTH